MEKMKLGEYVYKSVACRSRKIEWILTDCMKPFNDRSHSLSHTQATRHIIIFYFQHFVNYSLISNNYIFYGKWSFWFLSKLHILSYIICIHVFMNSCEHARHISCVYPWLVNAMCHLNKYSRHDEMWPPGEWEKNHNNNAVTQIETDSCANKYKFQRVFVVICMLHTPQHPMLGIWSE